MPTGKSLCLKPWMELCWVEGMKYKDMNQWIAKQHILTLQQTIKVNIIKTSRHIKSTFHSWDYWQSTCVVSQGHNTDVSLLGLLAIDMCSVTRAQHTEMYHSWDYWQSTCVVSQGHNTQRRIIPGTIGNRHV